MKALLYSAILLSASVSIVRATTIGFSAAPASRQIVDSSNTVLSSSNSLVWAGTFADESFSLNGNLSFAANVAAIQAHGWRQFTFDSNNMIDGDATSSLAISGAPSPIGRIGGTATDNNAGASFFDNKSLYLWVFNGSTVASSTQMGIFRATSATIPWVFAANANGVGDTVNYSTSSSQASVIAAIGGVGTGVSGAGTLKLSSLPAIPEPSTFGFGFAATLAAIGRRQRRK